jgi:predicted phosphodiesterase
MFILVFSDSHGNIEIMKKVIAKYKHVDMVIHLGDYLRDAVKLKESIKNADFKAILGNNDFNSNYEK